MGVFFGGQGGLISIGPPWVAKWAKIGGPKNRAALSDFGGFFSFFLKNGLFGHFEKVTCTNRDPLARRRKSAPPKRRQKSLYCALFWLKRAKRAKRAILIKKTRLRAGLFGHFSLFGQKAKK